MDFEFKRMDFNDISSLANYGQEILSEVERLSLSEHGVIDIDMKDIEMQRLMESIPVSIDSEIDKNVENSMPMHLSLADKVLSVKLLDSILPNVFGWKDKISKEVDEVKGSEENNNSLVLYNNIMDNIFRIRDKIDEDYLNTKKIVESLQISKDALIELKSKFDVIISEGEKSIEEYINSGVEDEFAQKKLSFARDQILSLRDVRATLDVIILSKDESALALYGYVNNLKKWKVTKFPILALGVGTSIEKKCLYNKVEQLEELNNLSKKAVLDGAALAKKTAEKNAKMLQTGEVDKDMINTYLKEVQAAFVPMKQYIQNKESTQKKLLADMDKIEADIKNSYKEVALIGESVSGTLIEEKPKRLILEAKNNKNE